MKKLMIYFILVFLVSLSWAGSDDNNGPRITFTEESHDFGTIIQGKVVEHIFTFYNTGKSDLTIKEVSTSCGCTAALVSSEIVKPGEKGEIKVDYNSEARSGKVTRTITVTSNDPVEPEKDLTITAEVNASMHGDFKAGDSLFSERCASCHAEPASGKKGKELYEAVCHFCHGTSGEGKTATKLIGKSKFGDKRMREMISDGVTGTEMPAFSNSHGGPLDDEQIESLVLFMKELGKEVK